LQRLGDILLWKMLSLKVSLTIFVNISDCLLEWLKRGCFIKCKDWVTASKINFKYLPFHSSYSLSIDIFSTFLNLLKIITSKIFTSVEETNHVLCTVSIQIRYYFCGIPNSLPQKHPTYNLSTAVKFSFQNFWIIKN